MEYSHDPLGEEEHSDLTSPLRQFAEEKNLGGSDPDEEPDETGHSKVEDKGDVAPFAVGLNLVKCAVGAGSFSFPYAFVQTGVVCGILGIVFFAAMAAYTMTLLADAEKTFCVKRGRNLLRAEPGGLVTRMTYPELMRAAYPTSMLGGANYMVGIMYGTIVMTSIGICVAYVLFITSTMNHGFGWDTDYLLMGLTLPLLGLALLQSFKFLAFTSVLGDIAVVSGLVGTIWGGLANGRGFTWPTNIPAFNQQSGGDVPTGLATMCFMFLIHMMCLPMTQSLKGDMKHPRKFHSVVYVSFSFIGVLNMIFTLLCICIFHSDSDGISNPIIKNLDKGAPLQAIRILLCLDLFFTVPMVLAVGREILETSTLHMLGMGDSSAQEENDREYGDIQRLPPTVSKTTVWGVRFAVRALMIGLILAFSGLAIMNSGVNQAFSDVIALIGGVSGSLLGLILPPLLYLKAHNNWVSAGHLAFLIFIVIIGWGLLGSTTYFTIKSMAHF